MAFDAPFFDVPRFDLFNQVYENLDLEDHVDVTDEDACENGTQDTFHNENHEDSLERSTDHAATDYEPPKYFKYNKRVRTGIHNNSDKDYEPPKYYKYNKRGKTGIHKSDAVLELRRSRRLKVLKDREQKKSGSMVVDPKSKRNSTIRFQIRRSSNGSLFFEFVFANDPEVYYFNVHNQNGFKWVSAYSKENFEPSICDTDNQRSESEMYKESDNIPESRRCEKVKQDMCSASEPIDFEFVDMANFDEDSQVDFLVLDDSGKNHEPSLCDGDHQKSQTQIYKESDNIPESRRCEKVKQDIRSASEPIDIEFIDMANFDEDSQVDSLVLDDSEKNHEPSLCDGDNQKSQTQIYKESDNVLELRRSKRIENQKVRKLKELDAVVEDFDLDEDYEPSKYHRRNISIKTGKYKKSNNVVLRKSKRIKELQGRKQNNLDAFDVDPKSKRSGRNRQNKNKGPASQPMDLELEEVAQLNHKEDNEPSIGDGDNPSKMENKSDNVLELRRSTRLQNQKVRKLKELDAVVEDFDLDEDYEPSKYHRCNINVKTGMYKKSNDAVKLRRSNRIKDLESRKQNNLNLKLKQSGRMRQNKVQGSASELPVMSAEDSRDKNTGLSPSQTNDVPQKPQESVESHSFKNIESREPQTKENPMVVSVNKEPENSQRTIMEQLIVKLDRLSVEDE